MKQGLTIDDLTQQIISNHRNGRDFVATTGGLNLRDGDRLEMPLNDSALSLRPNRIAHQQIADWCGIPKVYYDRLLADQPQLLSENVNTWFRTQESTPRMIRTIGDSARAFLSDRYHRLDNYDMMDWIMPHLIKSEAQIRSCELNDEHLYLKVTTQRLQAKIVGQPVAFGLMIRNSEVGRGSFVVMPMVEVLACTNGMVVNRAEGYGFRKAHLGGRISDDSLEGAQQIFSDETRQADDKAFWMKARDIVTHTLSQVTFDEIAKRMEGSALDKITSPQKTMELARRCYNLSEDQADCILGHLIEGGELSRWGLSQAVTRYAQDVSDYEAATELEILGGQIALQTNSLLFGNN